MREDRDLTGEHGCGACPLKKASRDQEWRARRQTADQRGDGKHGDADQQDALATEAVPQRAHRHKHGTHGDGVGVHDPLKLLEICRKNSFEGWQN